MTTMLRNDLIGFGLFIGYFIVAGLPPILLKAYLKTPFEITRKMYHLFETVTAMSHLQSQKQIRLQEARRFMLGENPDAASPSYRMRYNDASHLNWEHKRLFGPPPLRDAEQRREAAR